MITTIQIDCVIIFTLSVMMITATQWLMSSVYACKYLEEQRAAGKTPTCEHVGRFLQLFKRARRTSQRCLCRPAVRLDLAFVVLVLGMTVFVTFVSRWTVSMPRIELLGSWKRRACLPFSVDGMQASLYERGAVSTEALRNLLCTAQIWQLPVWERRRLQRLH